MTYSQREESLDQGRPIECYRFNRDYQAWRYTNADRPITIDSQVYEPRALIRTKIEDANEMQRNVMTLTAPRDLEVAELFRISPPTQSILLNITQTHENDDEVVTIWSGRVVDVDFQGINALITLEPIYTALRRNGLRRKYQRQCSHALYGQACGVNSEAVRIEAIVSNITGVTVTADAIGLQADAYYAGGFIEYEIAIGIFERRFILDHTGNQLTLNAQPVGMDLGQEIRVYPGCDHTIATCAAKFNNTLNYGGMPFMTLKNPFNGDPVF